MATGVGMGFDLEGLDKAIKSADKHLQDLAKQAEVQAKRISDAFSLGATKGIQQMMQELANVKDGLAELTRQDYKIKLSSNNFGQDVIDEVNRVINYTRAEFERLNKDKVAKFLIPDSSGSAPNVNLDDIKSIQERLAALSGAQSSGFMGFTQIDDRLRVQINDEIQALNERLKVLQMTTEEFNKMKSSEASKIMQTAQMQVDATNAELQRIEREKQAKLDAISAKATAEQGYQQRMQNISEQRRQRENSAMQEQLRQYEQSKQQVKELEEVRATAQRIMGGSSNRRLVEDARATYASVEEQLRLHKERMQKLERKYPVETSLINQDAANKDFVKQAKDYEDAKEKARKEALTKAQKAEEDAYQLWLARKSAEASEHKRIEDEKYQATVSAIRKQNEAFAAQEAERKRILDLQAQQRKTNQKTKDNTAEAKARYEETLFMYRQMFDKIAADEKNNADKRIAELERVEAKRKEVAKLYSGISPVDAKWAAESTKGVKPQIEAEEKAIQDLIQAKFDLDKQDKDYIKTIQNLDDKIAEHKRNIQRLNDAERQRVSEQNKQNQTFAGAIAFSDSAKTLQEERQAVKNLEAAREKLDKTDVNYQKDLNELNSRIKQHNKNIQETTARAKELQEKHRGLMDTSGQLARAMAAVFSVSAIKGYVNKLMQIRGEFELQQRSLQVLLQNKDEANALWDKTVALAVKSPYTTKQLVTATKQLAAYRIESEKLYETNKMLADVSIGLGVDMNRLILAFGQVKAANFLRGTELRQFSEAGVNMLDELAKRFTMLEGRAVSVGEVFERVSKRMVSFKDVEAVFKTITSEGGTFYQMQEKQSETLKGMKLNLKDSYELMLNDIGKSSEGMLKGFVSMMKTLVDNWQEIAFVVEKIGYALLTYTAVTKLAQLGTTKMAGTFLSFTGITTQSVKSLNLFQKVLTGIGMLGVGAVLAGLVYGFLEIWRVSTKASREAEHLQKELQEIYRTDYSEFKQQTKTFNGLVDKLKDVNQGSEEHREIIQNLNSQYGEYIGFVVTEATTYDKLKSSVEGVNQALLRKAKMATYEKAYTKIFDETNKTIDKGIEKLKSDIRRVTVTRDGSVVLPTEDEINDVIRILEKRLKSLGKRTPLWSDVQEAFKEYGLEVKQIRYWSNLTLLDWKNALITQKEAELKLEQQINAQYSDTTARTVEHRNALKQIDEIEKNRLKKAKDQGDTSSIAYQKEVDRIKKEAQIARIQAQVQYEGLDKDVANKRIAELNKFSDTVIDINNKIEASADKLGEKYASIIYINESEAESGLSQIAESTAQSYKTMQDVIKQQNALKEAGTVHDQNILENAERTAAAYYYKLQLLGRLDLLQEKTTDGSNKELQLLNKQLSALKEAKQTFDQLRQKFGLEAATKKTAKAFEVLFEELDMTEFTIDMTFDNQGIIDVINELPNKAGEAGKQAMEKLKAEMAGDIDVGVKVRKDEDLLRQIEDLFSGYELSLELEKLNIPPNLAKQLFNVDSISLPELKAQLVGKESQFVGTDREKQYRDYLQKVSKMEREAQQEMLKNYSKYLVQAQSERVKILLEQQRMLDKIASSPIGDEDKALMRKGVEKEIQKRLQQQAWKDFQESGMYLRLFENLEGASMQSLNTMEAKLKELRDSLTELDPTELKEINNQLEKIRELKIEKNPFVTLKEDAKTYFEYLKNKKDWEKSLSNSEAKEAVLQSNIDDLQLQIASQEKMLDSFEKIGNGANPIAKGLRAAIDEEKKRLKILLDQLEAQKLITKEERKRLEGGEDSQKSLKDSFSEAANYATGIASSLGDMTDSLESIFGMSDGLKDTLQVVQGVGMGLGDMLSGAAGIMSGNPLEMIQGGMQAINGISKIIGSFNEAYDNKQERKIEREIKLVERLGKLYEKLEKQIETAYSIDTFQAANDAAKENLEQQNQSIQRMIEAEEAKKDTDHKRIEEWREQMEENLEMLDELEAKRLQELGGVGGEDYYKDAAQGFVDAWLDAFYETGDGLTALEDEFDEVMKNLVKKQVLQRVAGALLEPLLTSIDTAVGNDGLFDEKEFANVMELAKQIFPEFNEKMKETIEAMGMTDWAGKNAELGSLAAGIQGVSEETANVISSYLNSIRFYVADSNAQLKTVVTTLTQETPNPMLTQLKMIATNTSQTATNTADIKSILESLSTPAQRIGGRGIKIVMD